MAGLDKKVAARVDPDILQVADFLKDHIPLTNLDVLFHLDLLNIHYILDQPYKQSECTASFHPTGYAKRIDIYIYYSAYWTVARFDEIGVYVPPRIHYNPIPKTQYFQIKLAHELVHAYEFYMGYGANEFLATLAELTYAYRYHNHYFRTQAKPIKHKKGNILCRMN